MRLELEIVHIKDIQFSDRTEIVHGELRINKDELQDLLERDIRFSKVDLALARPGESCRIVQVHDVIEPRAKTGGSGEDFPGALGKNRMAGRGSTRVLRGAAVVLSDCNEKGLYPTRDPNGDIIDMIGPAAEQGIYGKTFNLVLMPRPADRVNPMDYRVALKIAGLKAATYLAGTDQDSAPDDVEVYELPSLNEPAGGAGHLPRVVYIFQMLSMQFEPIPGEPVLYGTNIEGIVPTILHPNEVLDGAVLNSYRSICLETYVIQNHPMIKELYRQHGKEIYFAGTIITTAHNNPPEFERTANIAANLAKSVLSADGAILTKAGGGAPEVTLSQTARRCEELGIKTTIALVPMTADVRDPRSEASIIFNMPELNAIVSMGNPSVAPLELPAVGNVIGRAVPMPNGSPISDAHIRRSASIKGILCQMGGSKFKAVRY